ncbi:MAG: uracil-DNA glycosylase [Ruminococcaceae bacterium]|nr:uracil-DNA glycosylase [Oscillospiraceae bacterium]
MAKLDGLKKVCEECKGCPLWESRKNLVFGVGNEDADIMFIGEAPGQQEDEQGVPFVGAAGQLFDRYLFAVDIPRESVYIANILKCRPPRNRDPLPAEEDACIEHLYKQIEAIDPKIIVCLGRVSAKRLIDENYMITKQHGKWQTKGGRHITAVYHPSALLRDPAKKADMLEDMKAVKAKLDTLRA